MTKSREKFVELAEKRVMRAMKEMRLIGNLSNTTNYEYSEKDVGKIFKALETAMKESKAKFMNGGASSDDKFKLEN